jgi:hypothetical protein
MRGGRIGTDEVGLSVFVAVVAENTDFSSVSVLSGILQ